MNNEFVNKKGALVTINGGNRIPNSDCPKNWEEAKAWIEKVNNGENEIEWKFDCGFKLDYDGPLVSISSRFYPPKNFYGPNWDGYVSVIFKGESIFEKKFEFETREELRSAVEKFVNSIQIQIDIPD